MKKHPRFRFFKLFIRVFRYINFTNTFLYLQTSIFFCFNCFKTKLCKINDIYIKYFVSEDILQFHNKYIFFAQYFLLLMKLSKTIYSSTGFVIITNLFDAHIISLLTCNCQMKSLLMIALNIRPRGDSNSKSFHGAILMRSSCLNALQMHV